MQEVKRLYKYWEYVIKSRARGYYDFKSQATFKDDNPTYDIEMTPYELELPLQVGIPYTTSGAGLVLPYAWDYNKFLSKYL